MVDIHDSKPKLSEAELEEFEEEIGRRLPSAYRDFLLAHNGGRPVPNVFAISVANESAVHFFFGLHTGRTSNLRRYRDIYRGRIPEDLLPIALDVVGNVVCLGLAGEGAGKVFLWDSEAEGGSGTAPARPAPHPVADDLSGLLASLR